MAYSLSVAVPKQAYKQNWTIEKFTPVASMEIQL